MPRPFALTRNEHPRSDAEREKILAEPGFGNFFTDHMVHIPWTKAEGWGQAEVLPYGPIQLEPSAAVFHYGQEIFEGLKAYRHEDGTVWTFRPEANAERFQRSARRLCLPELPAEDFIEALRQLVEVDEAWVPTGGETSLYLRPMMFGSVPSLGVHSSPTVEFYLIASPAGSYFPGGVEPVDIWISTEYSRAAPGGTGGAKCGGNYASSLLPQEEAEAHGCPQVCFLDAEEHRYVEELGGMNLFIVTDDGRLVTPALTGTILEGVTRRTILELCEDRGLAVEEKRVLMADLLDAIADGKVTEVFACGTAAAINPMSSLQSPDGTWVVNGGKPGEHTMDIRDQLLDIQYGRRDDSHDWLTRLA